MKKLIKRIALWLLEWADEQEIGKISFGETSAVKINKYLVKENRWYHIAYTVSMFAKRIGKEKKMIDDVAIFIDGKVDTAKLWSAYKLSNKK